MTDSFSCTFCRSDAGKEEILMGKIAYGYKCKTCGATTKYSARKQREAAYQIAKQGEAASPWGIVLGLFNKKPKA
jgi:hypothetical protein